MRRTTQRSSTSCHSAPTSARSVQACRVPLPVKARGLVDVGSLAIGPANWNWQLDYAHFRSAPYLCAAPDPSRHTYVRCTLFLLATESYAAWLHSAENSAPFSKQGARPRLSLACFLPPVPGSSWNGPSTTMSHVSSSSLPCLLPIMPL